MIESSSRRKGVSESRRGWNCGNADSGEWTHEGKPRDFSVRGDVFRVKEKAYVSTPQSGGFFRNLGGTAGRLYPVPFLMGQDFLFL